MPAQFIPIVDSIKLQDNNYYYFTHGTYESNLQSILTHGLSPLKAAERSSRGAKTHEGTTSRDSIGKIKYATAPDIATLYSNLVPEKSKGTEIGILIQVRVSRGEFWRAYGKDRKYWKRESGGEDSPQRLGGLSGLGGFWANQVVKDPYGHPIFALETDQVIRPCNLRVIGYSKLATQSDPNTRLFKHLFD